MTSPYSLIFRSKTVLVGFLFLFIALFLSLVSVFVTTPSTHEVFGTLKPGFHSISNYSFETVTNRTLILESKNASVDILWDDEEFPCNVTGEVVLYPSAPPSINVHRGQVRYTYITTEIHYKYAYLAIPAFISLIIGVMLIWFGFVKVLGR